ncbi:MAG: maleylpyruvate isomerase family mycothiol-dependent enzyme [Mycobacteriales bacterium]
MDDRHRLPHDATCAAVAGEIEAFAAALVGADPAASVPTCPGWTVTHLVRHLGRVHRWAEMLVRTRAGEYREFPRDQLHFPDDPAGWPDWIRTGGERLVTTLRGAAPDEPMWAWGTHRRVRFWPRRQLHETTVHRTDLAAAAGSPAKDLDPVVALDGVEEFLLVMPHLNERLPELHGDGRLLFTATDSGHQWWVRLRPNGLEWGRHTSGTPDVTVRAPVVDLYLFLWGRVAVDTLAVDGDRALLDFWISHSRL